ncbi:acetolactate synthase [Planctomyces sp. SCGC AG-212-M04]|nr:acetolactate synthase [Planctomyces sp. SCGC AG-212-M04]
MAAFEDIGEGEGTDAGTMRGRGWPSLRQFCVFLENRVGRLHDLLRHMERHDLRVVGLSVVDSVDYCVIRIILHDVDRAREVFELSKFTVIENDILGVVLPVSDQPFIEIFLALMSAELNISYAYPILFRHDGRGALALHVDNLDQATQVLESKGHTLVREDDLLNDWQGP